MASPRWWQCPAALALLVVTGWVLVPAPAVAANSSVTLAKIKFFSARHFSANTCVARGTASKSFRTTVPTIYAQVVYTSWLGSHVQQSKWLAPDSSVYATSQATSFVGHGGLTSCVGLPVAGEPAAQLPGRWTYVVLVDKQQIAEGYFKLKTAPLH